MPTPSEQKALAFVAMVALLGGVVRVVRAGSPPAPTAIQQQALARQATAAESSASRPQPRRTRATGGRRARRSAEPIVIGGVSTVPPTGTSAPSAGRDGFPPPSPRIDVDYRDNRQKSASRVSEFPESGSAGRQAPVDLDRATAGEIEALPHLGRVMAGRIVANRDSFGAFGSLEALGRVKGLGPATRKRLATLVTFSGRPSSRP